MGKKAAKIDLSLRWECFEAEPNKWRIREIYYKSRVITKFHGKPVEFDSEELAQCWIDSYPEMP